MSGRILFTTESLPERDRFPAFCEEIARRYTALDFFTDDAIRFRTSLELRRAGGIDIGCISTSRLNSSRTRNLVHDGDDSILVTLLRHGAGYQTQCEDDQTLEAGDGVICDCGYPGDLNFTIESQFWHLKVPRNKIASLLPDVDRFGGARLNKDHTARRLLFGYLNGSFEIDLCGERIGRLHEDHIVGLIALALSEEGDVRRTAEEGGVRAVRRAAILREIDLYMADPNVGATTIARRLGITPRYLRMLLEETGKSFTEHLLERRLDRAAALLRDPARRHRRIAEIAFACGFGDLSYFNRVFRRRYGATPSDVREQSRRDDARLRRSTAHSIAQFRLVQPRLPAGPSQHFRRVACVKKTAAAGVPMLARGSNHEQPRSRFFRTVSLSGVCVCLILTHAFAASPTAYSWTGFYVGANAGYGWHGTKGSITGDTFDGAGAGMVNSVFGADSIAENTFPAGNGISGALGGLQIGFNWQPDPKWVTGIETDLQLAGVKGSSTIAGLPPVIQTLSTSQAVDWFGTVRGRLGYLLNDRFLLFGTAGLAYGQTHSSSMISSNGIGITFPPGFATTIVCPGGSVCVAASQSQTSAGWTAGGGVEYAAWQHVTLKVEYLHVDMGSQNLTLTVQPPSTGNAFALVHFGNSFDLVRGGVNYRF